MQGGLLFPRTVVGHRHKPRFGTTRRALLTARRVPVADAPLTKSPRQRRTLERIAPQ